MGKKARLVTIEPFQRTKRDLGKDVEAGEATNPTPSSPTLVATVAIGRESRKKQVWKFINLHGTYDRSVL